MQDVAVELSHLCQNIATWEYSQVICFQHTDSKNRSTGTKSVLPCVKCTNVYSFAIIAIFESMESQNRIIQYLKLQGTYRDSPSPTPCSLQDYLKLNHMTKSIIQTLPEL